MEKMKNEAQVTPIQRIHIFIWNIYNIIKNLNYIKLFLNITYNTKSKLELNSISVFQKSNLIMNHFSKVSIKKNETNYIQ